MDFFYDDAKINALMERVKEHNKNIEPCKNGCSCWGQKEELVNVGTQCASGDTGTVNEDGSTVPIYDRVQYCDNCDYMIY